MPATTPNYGIQYPVNTDLVKDGATAIGTVASTVDTLLGNSQFMGGFRNKLINGDFGIWQRGTSLVSTAGYSADRWIQLATSNITTTRQSLTTTARASAGIPATNRFHLQAQITGGAGASDYGLVGQTIENVGTLAGRTVTVSFWAWAAAGTPKVGVSIDQIFGTGGSPSADVNGNGQSVTLSTTPTRYSVQIAIPSISGKTIGTNNNDCVRLNLWLSAGTSFATRAGTIGVQSNTFAFANVQLEDGSVRTRYEERPFQTELALCQRYYEKSYPLGTAPGTITNSGALTTITPSTTAGKVVVTVRYAVPRRVSPTVTIFSDADGSAGFWFEAGFGNRAGAVGNNNETSFVAVNSVAAAAALAQYSTQWRADAEF